jgi:hypothetical protein
MEQWPTDAVFSFAWRRAITKRHTGDDSSAVDECGGCTAQRGCIKSQLGGCVLTLDLREDDNRSIRAIASDEQHRACSCIPSGADW